MDRADPRTAYDDLYEASNTSEVEPERFDELVDGEPFTTGWVTVASVLDSEGRMLLIYDEDDKAWVVPGGAVKPGESLPEAVTREVDEEAGVPIEPGRPHSAVEATCTDGDRSASFTVVGFEATPETTTVGADLGVDDETITDAAWFAELPEELFARDHAEALFERVRATQI
ncbi:NUDIX domain-containing protein [Halolamina sp. CBA1230]|uniref:NUDIX hydrolase n=1 Tax=Halolamina sp. CBA1230 TaxID=1853690 RepID=UPI0009A150B7|nr:NUDIX domain-containing protein [Halolamina sp. CBA1230]QKY19412.1 NUDIX domain-containing protein [Halolamina sp. CBA1230]